MKTRPDGSLCRITSSIKEPFNVRIVKVPKDQLKESEPSYKLVVMGENSECESLSDKSDEEMSEEEEICNIQLPVKKIEKVKDTDTKADRVAKANKQENKETGKRPYYSNKKHRHHRNLNQRNSIMPSGLGHKPVLNTSGRNIQPWITPPPALLNVPSRFPYQAFPHYENVVEHVRPNVLNSSENSGKGLLGDSPFSPLPPIFPPNNMNSPFLPMPPHFPPNNQTDNYSRDQNFHYNKYNPDFRQSNCSLSGPNNIPLSQPKHHQNYYRPYNKRWNTKMRKTPDSWNRHRGESQKRRKPPDNFPYRK